jgi:16S rRNA (cytosine967-C5)-methyltransferase
LQESGIAAAPFGEQGLLLARPLPVQEIPGFAEGLLSVQDAGAQLAAQLLLGSAAPSPAYERAAIQGAPGEGEGVPGEPMGGRRILDACAAPGGKTAHIAELADAQLLALDIDPARCERIHQNLQRLGLQAQVRTADAALPADWWDGRPFDAILLDAPCTASGIVRRHPDVRWLRRESDIAALAAQQLRLLDALWPLLKPGGRLVYCTCSVFKAEGEGQIAAFVAHNSAARLRPAPGHLLPRNAAGPGGVPDNEPGDHDGFFYAVLQKGARDAPAPPPAP